MANIVTHSLSGPHLQGGARAGPACSQWPVLSMLSHILLVLMRMICPLEIIFSRGLTMQTPLCNRVQGQWQACMRAATELQLVKGTTNLLLRVCCHDALWLLLLADAIWLAGQAVLLPGSPFRQLPTTQLLTLSVR